MNYQKIYNDLINKRKLSPPENCYTERHHIIPVCMNGTNDKDNLVTLTAREHFVAHALLVKIYKNDKRYYFKLLRAITAMQRFWGRISVDGNLRKPNKTYRLYANWKIQLSQYIKDNKDQFAFNLNKKAVYNNKLHKVRILNPDDIEPFILDNPDWSREKDNTWPKHQSTKNMIHIYNIETNKGTLINKYEDIPDGWLKGCSPNSNMHIQQYNPTKGKMWVTNLDTNKAELWFKDKELPKNYVKGKVNLKLRKDKTDIALRPQRQPPKRKYPIHPKLTDEEKAIIHEEKMAAYREREKIRRAKFRSEQREKYLVLLDDYIKLGYNGFLKKHPDYTKSRNNLCNRFRKYCKEEFEEYKNLKNNLKCSLT